MARVRRCEIHPNQILTKCSPEETCGTECARCIAAETDRASLPENYATTWCGDDFDADGPKWAGLVFDSPNYCTERRYWGDEPSF